MPDPTTSNPSMQAAIPAENIKATIPAQVVPLQNITSTQQHYLMTEGQRKVNLIWEYTQAAIAVVVVVCTMLTSMFAIYHGVEQVPNVVAVAFGTVVGFYFSRTNHAAIGGVGSQPTQEYIGR